MQKQSSLRFNFKLNKAHVYLKEGKWVVHAPRHCRTNEAWDKYVLTRLHYAQINVKNGV